ncbi:MAG: ROK family protein [Bacteroidia bacterium]|nr:ROK family protein [Bacteroidia bacterium]NNF31082.1 ROK family protein [Flavobacteriaceae bacterium]MBT8276954.1 ROK family protein [Bacteroidia bacterium]NNJ82450.1 ROK family protein [Flavobacteriaceae bacterium]NNK55315.1 ROK family protein [Flavobacteriaceae bacterium]
MNGEYLGVDLGGTSFNIGRVKSGMVIDEVGSDIISQGKATEVLATLTSAIDQVITPEVKGIGVGVPGIVDTKNGIIYDIQNIPAWKEIQLQHILEDKYEIPVVLNNDANCFALAEKKFGKGQIYENFVGLSIGTGLGMGIIINDQLYDGVMCGAGEIGMLPYKDGIVEQYAASFFFAREYDRTAKEMHEAARDKELIAIEAFDEFGIHLGEAIKIILFMYAPQAIILGGSISKAYQYFEKTMKHTIADFAYPKQLNNLNIVVSTHPNLPVLGASALCLDNTH